MSLVHLALHLHHSKFFVKRVEFSRLTCVWHIGPCTFTIANFLLNKSSFFNSHGSSLFGLTLMSWWIYCHANKVFSTIAPHEYLSLCHYHGGSLITRIGYSWFACLVTFCIVPPLLWISFLYRSSFLNSCISNIFDLAPLSWQIFHHTGRVFSTHMPWAHLAFVPLLWKKICHVGWVFLAYVSCNIRPSF